MSLRSLLDGVDSLASQFGLIPESSGAHQSYERSMMSAKDFMPDPTIVIYDPDEERTVVDPTTPWGKLQKHQRRRILEKRDADYHYYSTDPRGYDALFPEYEQLQTSMNPVSGLNINIDRTYHEPFLFTASNFNFQSKLFQLGSEEARLAENAFGVGYTQGDLHIDGHIDEDKFTGKIKIDIPTKNLSYTYERKQTHLPLQFEISTHHIEHDFDRTRFDITHKSSHSRTMTSMTSTHQFWSQFYLGFKLKLIHGKSWQWAFRGHYQHFHPFIYDHNNYPYPPTTHHTTTVDIGSHAFRLRHWHRFDEQYSFLAGVKLAPSDSVYFANAILQYNDWFWGNTHQVEANTYGEFKYAFLTHMWGLPAMACKLFASLSLYNPLSPTIGVEFNYNTEHRPGYGTWYTPQGFVPFGLPKLQLNEYTVLNNQVRRRMGILPTSEDNEKLFVKKTGLYRPAETIYETFSELHRKVKEEQNNLERAGGSSILLLEHLRRKFDALRTAGILPRDFDPENRPYVSRTQKDINHHNVYYNIESDHPIDEKSFPSVFDDPDILSDDGPIDIKIGYYHQYYLSFIDDYIQEQLKLRQIDLDVELLPDGTYVDPVLNVIGPKLAKYYEAFDYENFRFAPPSLFMLNRRAKRRGWYYDPEHVTGEVSKPVNSYDEVENKFYWGAWVRPEDVILQFESPAAVAELRAYQFWLSVLRFEGLLGVHERISSMQRDIDLHKIPTDDALTDYYVSLLLAEDEDDDDDDDAQSLDPSSDGNQSQLERKSRQLRQILDEFNQSSRQAEVDYQRALERARQHIESQSKAKLPLESDPEAQLLIDQLTALPGQHVGSSHPYLSDDDKIILGDPLGFQLSSEVSRPTATIPFNAVSPEDDDESEEQFMERLRADPYALQHYLAQMASVQTLQEMFKATHANRNIFGSSAAKSPQDLDDELEDDDIGMILQIEQLQKQVATISDTNHKLIIQLQLQLNDDPENDELRERLRKVMEIHESNLRSQREANELLLLQQELELDRIDHDYIDDQLKEPFLPDDIRTLLQHRRAVMDAERDADSDLDLQDDDGSPRIKKGDSTSSSVDFTAIFLKDSRSSPTPSSPSSAAGSPTSAIDEVLSAINHKSIPDPHQKQLPPRHLMGTFGSSDTYETAEDIYIPQRVSDLAPKRLHEYHDSDYDEDVLYFRSAAAIAKDLTQQHYAYTQIEKYKYDQLHPQLILPGSGPIQSSPALPTPTGDALATLSTKASLMNAMKHQYTPQLPSQSTPVNIGPRAGSGVRPHDSTAPASHTKLQQLGIHVAAPVPKKKAQGSDGPSKRYPPTPAPPTFMDTKRNINTTNLDDVGFPFPPDADDEEYYSTVHERNPTPVNRIRKF